MTLSLSKRQVRSAVSSVNLRSNELCCNSCQTSTPTDCDPSTSREIENWNHLRGCRIWTQWNRNAAFEPRSEHLRQSPAIATNWRRMLSNLIFPSTKYWFFVKSSCNAFCRKRSRLLFRNSMSILNSLWKQLWLEMRNYCLQEVRERTLLGNYRHEWCHIFCACTDKIFQINKWQGIRTCIR